jgi:hypothetical protein
MLNVVDELVLLVHLLNAGVGPAQQFARPLPLGPSGPLTQRANTASAISVSGMPFSVAAVHRPLSRALLPGLVEDQIHHRLAPSPGRLVPKDVGG